MNRHIAVVGTGRWGRNLVRVFQELGSLAAISDPDGETASALSTAHKVSAEDFETLLRDSTIKGIALATPAALHYQLAKECLLAGKDVFVEKPLALAVRDAEELCLLAEERSAILMVGHLMQYHPAFVRLKELVSGGVLGSLQYVYSNRLNLGRFRQAEDILWSFAPHDISMILSLIGSEPESVQAVGSYYLESGIADVTTTHMAFPEGERAHVYVSWLHPYKEQRLVVVGEGGMAVFDDAQPWESKLLLYPHEVSWEGGFPEPVRADAEAVHLEAKEPLLLECEHFIECIRTRAQPRTDGPEGLRVLRVLDRAATSMTEREEQAKPVHPDVMVHPTAVIDDGSEIGAGTKIWHFSHILSGSDIGPDCTIGQNVMIGPNVSVGARCKIQNNVSVYQGVSLEDDVFLGPSCVFTNVKSPRSEIDRSAEFEATQVREGATVGANATIVCGVELGDNCFVAAGAVVTKDVPPHALVAGVPAKRIGWVSHAGERLSEDLVCPRTGRRYRLNDPDTLVVADE